MDKQTIKATCLSFINIPFQTGGNFLSIAHFIRCGATYFLPCFPFFTNCARLECSRVYRGWSVHPGFKGGFLFKSATQRLIWAKVMSSESHNWKLSIHRQDTASHRDTWRELRGVAGLRPFGVSMCWVALYPTILLKWWADTKQFTIHPASANISNPSA